MSSEAHSVILAFVVAGVVFTIWEVLRGKKGTPRSRALNELAEWASAVGGIYLLYQRWPEHPYLWNLVVAWAAWLIYWLVTGFFKGLIEEFRGGTN